MWFLVYYYMNISYCARFSLAVDQSQVMDVCDTLLEALHYGPTSFQHKFKILYSIDKKKLTNFLDLHILLFSNFAALYFSPRMWSSKSALHIIQRAKSSTIAMYSKDCFYLAKNFEKNFHWTLVEKLGFEGGVYPEDGELQQDKHRAESHFWKFCFYIWPFGEDHIELSIYF